MEDLSWQSKTMIDKLSLIIGVLGMFLIALKPTDATPMDSPESSDCCCKCNKKNTNLGLRNAADIPVEYDDDNVIGVINKRRNCHNKNGHKVVKSNSFTDVTTELLPTAVSVDLDPAESQHRRGDILAPGEEEEETVAVQHTTRASTKHVELVTIQKDHTLAPEVNKIKENKRKVVHYKYKVDNSTVNPLIDLLVRSIIRMKNVEYLD